MNNREFTQMILEKMGGVLKPRGYRKRGSTFARECGDDVVLEVSLQKSRTSSSTALKATVNLQAYSRTLTRAMGYPMDYPADPHRHWQKRIGAVMPERCDRWWVVRTSEEAVRAGEEIVEALTFYGLHALEEVSSTERLRALWSHRGENPDYLAALADPQGWQEEQKRRLHTALDRYEARHSE